MCFCRRGQHKSFELWDLLPEINAKVLQRDVSDARLRLRDCQQQVLGCNVCVILRSSMLTGRRQDVESPIREVRENAPNQRM